MICYFTLLNHSGCKYSCEVARASGSERVFPPLLYSHLNYFNDLKYNAISLCSDHWFNYFSLVSDESCLPKILQNTQASATIVMEKESVRGTNQNCSRFKCFVVEFVNKTRCQCC